jgi:hypothetical protein
MLLTRLSLELRAVMALWVASSLVQCQSTLISAVSSLTFYLRYCLQHSPVPVIVVHPTQRRQHRKDKRVKNPDRQSYLTLLKTAKEYSSSSDSLAGPGTPSIAIDPGLDTPGYVTPEEELAPVVSDPASSSGGQVAEAENEKVLIHAFSAPATFGSSSSDQSKSKASEPKKKELSLSDKG